MSQVAIGVDIGPYAYVCGSGFDFLDRFPFVDIGGYAISIKKSLSGAKKNAHQYPSAFHHMGCLNIKLGQGSGREKK